VDFDLTGLAIAIAVGGLLAALGLGVDSILLNRHIKAVDDIALKWWFFFDELRVLDMPRIAVGLYLRGKNKVLGRGFSATFVLRSFLLSLLLTAITVPGGRSLGIALVVRCNALTGAGDHSFTLNQFLTMGWGWTGMNSLLYLVPVNLVFDLTTIFVTIFLLSKALEKPDYFLISLVILDIIACFILVYNAIYIADRYDGASIIAVDGYWRIFPNLLNTFTLGCGAFHFLTSKILFVSTILLPTLLYLIMIVGLFLLREGFKLFRVTTMHLLEKSVEDKKTIFAHLGTTCGMVIGCGKCVLEVSKAISA
jgi:hypothetical protein